MSINYKYALVFYLTLLFSFNAVAQSYSTERVAWVNYLTRMYKSAPFEGVRVIDDYDTQYLISVIAIDPARYSDEAIMNRVASVKAMSQASRFFNGARITSDLIIRTNEKSDGSYDTVIIETINEKSNGFIKALEHMTSFSLDDTKKKIFIFGTIVKI